MKVVIGILLSTALHVALGWQWCLVAGAIVGWWTIRHGWLFGAVAVGTSWTLLTSYNYVIAPEQMKRFTATMAGFVPGMPDWSVPVLTVALGIVLGAVGGFLGQCLVPLIRRSGGNGRMN